MTVTHYTKKDEGAYCLWGSDVTLLQQSPAAGMLFILASLWAEFASCFTSLHVFRFYSDQHCKVQALLIQRTNQKEKYEL